MKELARAFIGLILVFVIHIPRLIYSLLLLSFAAVYNNHPTLTANPQEHLNRAKKILKRGRLSELLYAAIELRFALERMAQRDLIFAERASKRMIKEYDPLKKLANLHRIAPESAFAHEIYFINKLTGDYIKWSDYKPLDRVRVGEIKGRLGDILHPKDGLLLGIPSDPWYMETRKFLKEAAEYLEFVYKNNSLFFAYEGLDNFEMIKVE